MSRGCSSHRGAESKSGGAVPAMPCCLLYPPNLDLTLPVSPILEFERRQARPLDNPLHREEEGTEFQQKMEETRQPPPRMRPVPSLVPRPPQTSLVKFVGNIYTLKCR